MFDYGEINRNKFYHPCRETGNVDMAVAASMNGFGSKHNPVPSCQYMIELRRKFCFVLNVSFLLYRISSGKSTVINALLGENVLTSAMGHTSSCFVQVEKSKDDKDYLVTPEAPDDHKSKEV